MGQITAKRYSRKKRVVQPVEEQLPENQRKAKQALEQLEAEKVWTREACAKAGFARCWVLLFS